MQVARLHEFGVLAAGQDQRRLPACQAWVGRGGAAVIAPSPIGRF